MAKLIGTFTEPQALEELSVTHHANHVFSVTVTNINTNIVLRVEYSYDKVTWHNLDEQDFTITANDTYNLIINQDFPIEFLRLNWVSESGGTAAEIKVLYLGTN